jgi:two-component system LytT family response regulator
VTAFELEALDYILKPFGRERFTKVLERVRRRLAGERSTAAPSIRKRALAASAQSASGHLLRMFVRDARGRIVHLRVSDITRLAGADDYVEVHANNASYLVNLTLSEFEARLDPQHFRRIHRSAIVNLDHLVSCTPIDRRLLLKLSDGSEVIASRSGSQALRALLV